VLLDVLVLGPLALSGCSGDTGDGIGRGDRYVAMGDSYSAGSGLPRIDPASKGCQRSPQSYPRLVTGALHVDLTDVTCGGASTLTVTGPQSLRNGASAPPQLAAVTAKTDLVTVGLGYNDDAYYAGLVFGCAVVAPTDPAGAPCRTARAAQPLSGLTDEVGEAVRATLEKVHDKGPRAEVFLVGYPQLVPESGTCPELPLAEGDYAYVREGLRLLDESLRRAAEDGDATYVDVWSASEGHDICAGAEAWVSGAAPPPGVAAPYHPFESGQRAIADVVLEAVKG
jgi:lysophospholipase L1-like esterase